MREQVRGGFAIRRQAEHVLVFPDRFPRLRPGRARDIGVSVTIPDWGVAKR
jgi:hypothetical protein